MSVGDEPVLPAGLVDRLEQARTLGFLGPGPVEDHVRHSWAFLAALTPVEGVLVDLGSGGGVPGLPVALARPDLEVVLVEAGGRRAALLEEAVRALGLGDRVRVVHGRAEVVGRSTLRGACAAVLARGFGPPPVTAECAAPLLRLGGRLVVSEPPDARTDRWPAKELAPLGLAPTEALRGPPRLQVLVQTGPCPERYPRRDGTPAKRPLF